MEEWNHWRLFLNTGSVLDYLEYKRAQAMKDTGAEPKSLEDDDEISDRRSDYQGTEYR